MAGRKSVTVWRSLPARTRVAATPGGLRAATRLQAAGWPDTAQLRLRSTARSPRLPPARMPARSIFFFRRLGVIGRHGPAFAHPQRVACAHPGARALIAVAGLMQHLANGFGGDLGQVRLA